MPPTTTPRADVLHGEELQTERAVTGEIREEREDELLCPKVM